MDDPIFEGPGMSHTDALICTYLTLTTPLLPQIAVALDDRDIPTAKHFFELFCLYTEEFVKRLKEGE